MKPIIEPIAREKIEAELTQGKFVRFTNNSNNEIYIITAHDSPAIMQEVGRLREISFRKGGGGTGKVADIDEYDTAEENAYKQLIVWNPDDREISGGYRFLKLNDVLKTGKDAKQLATAKLFKFSEQFVEEYMPYTMELGRSFVQPKYQSTQSVRKAIFALDNLWDGLGSLAVDNPDIKYYFGKVTMYQQYNTRARDLLLYFLHKYFPDNEQLLVPHHPLQYQTDEAELAKTFSKNDYTDDYKILSSKVRELKETIPPLINAYMNLSSTMRVFGTAINERFGDVEETAILIKLDDIYPAKKERHIVTYRPKAKR